jgi:acetylornithine deacetylase
MPRDYLGEQNLLSWLQHLVRYPSEQTELHERDPQVLGFIKACAAPLLRDIGADYRFDPMGNLIAEAGPRDTGRSLLFVAYAMTHPAANMSDPFAAALIDTPSGTAVRGRGVAEQKTALAAVLGAFGAAVARGKLGGRLILALTTAGETGRHDAVESVMREIKADPRFAIICIGTNNRVAVGNKGRLDLDVVIKGKASHSSAPWNGINAIAGARRVLERLENLDLNVPDHPAFGPATLTATAIESAPKATHTVPDTVRITFDRRLLPGEEPLAAFAALERAIRIEEPWKVECRRGPVMYPNQISLDGPLFSHLRAAFACAGLAEPQPFYCNFALDAGYFARKGIEAVMLGPGEVDQFHSDEEHVLVSDLVAMANVYDRMIEQCLAPNA